MMEQGLRKLQEIAAKMKEEREQGLAPNPPATTVREFISWFGFQRRSSWLIDRVRNELEAHGLHTEPDFENTYIDSTICFRDSAVSTPPSDGTLRVDALEAAHNSPIAVAPDDDLKKATTIMLCNGFSHVPVMTGTRDVKGIVTWESIGRSADQTGDKARQYMTSPQVIDGRRPLFEGLCLAGDFSTNTGLKRAWKAEVQSRDEVALARWFRSRIASTANTMPRGGNRTEAPACRRVRW